MAISDPSLVNMQDLRAIIHTLRMANLASLEDTKLADVIRQRIKHLPGPEAINRLAEDAPAILDSVKKEISEILKMVDDNSKRDMVFRVKYRAKTNLDPRYKVLDWRDNMQTQAKELSKLLVKISSSVDDKGQGVLAGQLIKCAKNFTSSEPDSEEFFHAVVLLKKAGFDDEALELTKFAQASGWQGFMQGVQGLGRQVLDPMRSGRAFNKVKNVLLKVQTDLQEVDRYIGGILPKIDNPQHVHRIEVLRKSITATFNAAQDAVRNTTEALKAMEGGATPDASAAPSAHPNTQQPGQPSVQAPPPVDVSTMSAQDVDAALAALGITASKRTVFNRMAAGLSLEMTNYIATIRNDPAALKKFVDQLKARKAQLATVSPTGTTTAAPDASKPAVPTSATPEPVSTDPTHPPVNSMDQQYINHGWTVQELADYRKENAGQNPIIMAAEKPENHQAYDWRKQKTQSQPAQSQPAQPQFVPSMIRGPGGKWVPNPAYKGRRTVTPKPTVKPASDDFPIIES